MDRPRIAEKNVRWKWRESRASLLRRWSFGGCASRGSQPGKSTSVDQRAYEPENDRSKRRMVRTYFGSARFCMQPAVQKRRANASWPASVTNGTPLSKVRRIRRRALIFTTFERETRSNAEVVSIPDDPSGMLEA